jgi:BirA family biotin operon repressor/biotin-[acetyl-CoA-carboxylase] ligase
MIDELRETAVQSALQTKWVGRAYHYFEHITSTNNRLKEAVADGSADSPPPGTVFLANYQSQGRGRFDRRWLAPLGTSLLLSILFRPDWPPEQAQWLAMIASLAAAEAVEGMTSLSVGVKWPNDLVVQQDGMWHKFSGLLLEGRVGEDGRLQSIIIGIGINVNIPAEQLPEAVTPATSLLAATGQPIARLDLLAAFLQRLEERYEQAVQGHSPQPAWNQRLITLGKQVQVTHRGTGQPLLGIAEGTNVWGQLQIRDEHGRLHTIAAGDVTLR